MSENHKELTKAFFHVADRNERIATLEAEVKRLQGEQYLPGTPHADPSTCSMWYDHCNCTVENLEFNVKRAEQAEAEVERMRAIERIVRDNIGNNITRPEVYHVAGQDTNHRLCLVLIALDEWRAALAPQGDGDGGQDL